MGRVGSVYHELIEINRIPNTKAYNIRYRGSKKNGSPSFRFITATLENLEQQILEKKIELL